MTIRHLARTAGPGLLAALLFVPAVFATDRIWNVSSGTESNFFTGSNWTSPFATAWDPADRAIINNGGTAVIASGTVSLTEIWAGNTGSNTGTFKQTGGALTLTDGLVIGRQGTAQGAYQLLGGTLDIRNLRLGGGAAGAGGTLTISGSGTKLTTGISNEVTSGLKNGFVSIGSPGTGTVTLSDSAIWEHRGTAYFAVGSDNNAPAAAGGNGSLTVSSGAKLQITGTSTGRNLFIGKNSGAVGVVTISGADSEIQLGSDGSIVLGGTNNDGASPGAGGYGTGTLNLNGGTVTAASIVKGAGGTATVKFNGGTIKASAANANFFGSSSATNTAAIPAASLEVKSGGLTFDTNSYQVGITQALGGAGGLTKIGAGTLTLSGASTYAGATVLSGGTLALGGGDVLPDASNLTLNAGTLALAGFSDALGALIVNGAATLDFGSGAGANALRFADSSALAWTGTLTLTNFDPTTDALTFSGSGGLTGWQLNSIVLSGYAVTGLNGSGAVQFTAVPEPATYGIATAALLFTALLLRRRRTA